MAARIYKATRAYVGYLIGASSNGLGDYYYLEEFESSEPSIGTILKIARQQGKNKKIAGFYRPKNQSLNLIDDKLLKITNGIIHASIDKANNDRG